MAAMSRTPGNQALWLSNFSSPLELVNLPIPEATAGSVVVEVLNTTIFPYADDIHKGHLPVFNLTLPLVPHPSHIGRIHAVGSDAVTLKPGHLIYFSAFITARDDESVFMIQGHHGGEDPRAKKLMQGEWRDGALQQYQKIPLENAFLLDSHRLCGELGYNPADLHEISFYAMGVGAICEAARLQPGETILIGPATGTFGGIASEVALAVGANVIAIGRSRVGLARLQQQLGKHERFRFVVMTGDLEADSAAIIATTPGKRGVDVYNDWTSSALEGSPFFASSIRAMRNRGRVVLSGAPAGTIAVPYAFVMHHSIMIIGKLGVERSGIKLTISMIESGLIKLGHRGGAGHALYSLSEHQEAFEAAKQGGFKNYHDIVPCPW
ncbi:NAD(P)-binding protein [Aaosphaeria arxii CBS 175.79]|uniref:NAD(P)-binding protein n=1 Tax=Aaosphaeria arxii CBS 175.79 TaxID=1450172 RepID=A0A6A5X792_9PLEO|nr:NAD(P)-binding protein [Aaosphaeria arxii CBS 175.79]KAF2008790.1 NAD(P)-binding protein [Aaosphaeria arxii CBS 175.79]